MQYFQLFIFLVVLALGVVVVSLEEIVKVLVLVVFKFLLVSLIAYTNQVLKLFQVI